MTSLTALVAIVLNVACARPSVSRLPYGTSRTAPVAGDSPTCDGRLNGVAVLHGENDVSERFVIMAVA